MTKYFFGMYWSIGFRNGFGFDIEAADTRPVWLMDGEDMYAGAFNGIVVMLPLLIFTVGNLGDIDE
jgi:hypothetical protein